MIDPLFPFGFGLSYTEFEYSALKISSPEINEDDDLNISVDIKNVGMMEGKEVIQLYIRDEISSLVRPVKELKGFKKVNLKPGEKKTIDFKINKQHLSFYDPVKKKWIAEPGVFIIKVGSSSRDIHLKSSFTLVGK
jgi:beta-glucosidase